MSRAHFVLQTNLMILYLEAVNYKVVTALATLEGHPPAASNTFSQHIETTRDKNGHQMSLLKVRTHADRERRSLTPTEIYRTVVNNNCRLRMKNIFIFYCPGKLGHDKNTKCLNCTGNRAIYILYSIRLACNLTT